MIAFRAHTTKTSILSKAYTNVCQNNSNNYAMCGIFDIYYYQTWYN